MNSVIMILLKESGVKFLLFFIFSYATLNAQNINLYSNELKQYRTVDIHLPVNYDSSTLHYPVVFLFDGNEYYPFLKSVYDYNTWDAYPYFIIVSINQVKRWEELKVDSKFEKFILRELLPFISKNYRTNNFNVVAGQSFGGAFTLDLLTKSNKIKAAISISPTIIRESYNLLDIYKKYLNNRKRGYKEIYLSYGTNDYKNIIAGSQKFKFLLDSINDEKIKVSFEVYADENHGSTGLIGLRRGIESIFKDFFVPENVWKKVQTEKNPSPFFDYFNKLNDLFKVEITPSEDDYNQLGYFYLSINKVDEAIKIFKTNIKRFPLSYNVYDSLGEAYLKSGNKQLSLFYYGQALAMAKSIDKDDFLIQSIKSKIQKIIEEK